MVRGLALLLAVCAALPAAAQDKKNPDEYDPSKNLRPDDQVRLGKIKIQIEDSIRSGCERLIQLQNRDGSWSEHATSHDRTHHIGITALCTYTLLKSGFPTSHPAVRKALIYMTGVPPTLSAEASGSGTSSRRAPTKPPPIEITLTYDAGCLLMALAATHDEVYKPVMQQVADLLVSWHVKDTQIWTYGKGGGGDLSNTQYAAFGLRVAQVEKLNIPPDVYTKLLAGVYKRQQKIEFRERTKERIPDPKGGGGTSVVITDKKKMPVGGFHYSDGADDFAATNCGSMTTAGAAIVAVCRIGLEAANRIKPKDAEEARISEEAGVNWLDENFSVTENPFRGGQYYYYLYGLERVGSILNIEYIGDHPWYVEGAEQLVNRRDGAGGWGGESDTCFAVLFLKRATRALAATGSSRGGPKLAAAGGGVVSIRSEKGEVLFTGNGSSPMNIWISGFPDAVKSAFGGEKGLRIASVEYLINGQVVETVKGKPRDGWKSEPYAAALSFPGRGTFKINVRVHLIDPADAANETKPKHVATGEEQAVTVRDVWDPTTMERYPHHRRLNLILTTRDDKGLPLKLEIKTSSDFTPKKDNDPGTSGVRAFDGVSATAWASKNDDKAPMIQVTFKGKTMPVGQTIVLGQLNRSFSLVGHHDKIKKVSMSVNGGPEFTADLDPDDLKPTYIKLPQTMSVSSLQIKVTDREPGGGGKGVVGFTEIGIEAAPPSK